MVSPLGWFGIGALIVAVVAVIVAVPILFHYKVLPIKSADPTAAPEVPAAASVREPQRMDGFRASGLGLRGPRRAYRPSDRDLRLPQAPLGAPEPAGPLARVANHAAAGSEHHKHNGLA